MLGDPVGEDAGTEADNQDAELAPCLFFVCLVWRIRNVNRVQKIGVVQEQEEGDERGCDQPYSYECNAVTNGQIAIIGLLVVEIVGRTLGGRFTIHVTDPVLQKDCTGVIQY